MVESRQWGSSAFAHFRLQKYSMPACSHQAHITTYHNFIKICLAVQRNRARNFRIYKAWTSYLWLWYSISLDDARDSVSALSVSDCLDDVSILSDDVGVSSLGGFTGLEALDPRKGDAVSLNFLNGSVLGWNKVSLVLLGELSWRLALRWSGVGLRRLG